MKFKAGDKVRIVKNVWADGYYHEAVGMGEVHTIVKCVPDKYPYVLDAHGEYTWCDEELDLVEDKKVFTYENLKTGMFGVMSDGNKFVVVNDTLVYQDDGYDFISGFREDLSGVVCSIDKVWTGVHSFRMLDRVIDGTADYGTLVYDRKINTNKFTKSDLQNGDVILKRKGHVEIVVLPIGTLVAKHGFNLLSDINDDLTSKIDSNYDIVAVRRPTKPKDCSFEAFDADVGELVYDNRPKTVNVKVKKVKCNGECKTN